RHDDRVHPLAVVEQRVAAPALDDEAGLLVGPPGAGVEGVDLQLDAVQRQVLERVAEQQPGGLGAQPAALAGRAEHDPEVAGLVAPVPVVEDDLPDAGAGRAVDHHEVEPVGLLVAGGVPLAELVERVLLDLVGGVDAAGETADLRVVDGLLEVGEVLLAVGPEDDELPGERRLVRERRQGHQQPPAVEQVAASSSCTVGRLRVASQACRSACSKTSTGWAPETPSTPPSTKNGTPRAPYARACCSSACTASANSSPASTSRTRDPSRPASVARRTSTPWSPTARFSVK